jgi:hypothetical protein
MVLRAIRWLLLVLGGVLLGAGLFLHGQVAVARDIRGQVDGTFFLWREIGRATFFMQGSDPRIGLTLAEVPEEVLQMSNRTGWTLVWFGLAVAVLTPWLLRPRGRGPAPKRKPPRPTA